MSEQTYCYQCEGFRYEYDDYREGCHFCNCLTYGGSQSCEHFEWAEHHRPENKRDTLDCSFVEILKKDK